MYEEVVLILRRYQNSLNLSKKGYLQQTKY